MFIKALIIVNGNDESKLCAHFINQCVWIRFVENCYSNQADLKISSERELFVNYIPV